jgi:hypothetical protein
LIGPVRTTYNKLFVVHIKSFVLFCFVFCFLFVCLFFSSNKFDLILVVFRNEEGQMTQRYQFPRLVCVFVNYFIRKIAVWYNETDKLFLLSFPRYMRSPKVANRIGGVMVSVLASSAVDRGLEPKTLKLVFVAYPLITQH